MWEKLENKYIPSKQSANVLFKFMKEFKYLKDILDKKAILPRYCEESIEYLDIKSSDKKLNKIVFPMVCFCDINFSRLEEHVYYYGKFGIGFSKEWAIKKGVQPIHYINENSSIKKDISYLFSKAYNDELNESLAEYNNYLFIHLLYMKPIIGKMRREGDYDGRNFTDEKEWRFIPKVEDKHGLPIILEDQYIENDTAYNSFSEGITQVEDWWLKFEFNDIEYLMVENEAYRQKLIEFILENNNIENKDKYILISKILVYDIINKDW